MQSLVNIRIDVRSLCRQWSFSQGSSIPDVYLKPFPLTANTMPVCPFCQGKEKRVHVFAGFLHACADEVPNYDTDWHALFRSPWEKFPGEHHIKALRWDKVNTVEPPLMAPLHNGNGHQSMSPFCQKKPPYDGQFFQWVMKKSRLMRSWFITAITFWLCFIYTPAVSITCLR